MHLVCAISLGSVSGLLVFDFVTVGIPPFFIYVQFAYLARCQIISACTRLTWYLSEYPSLWASVVTLIQLTSSWSKQVKHTQTASSYITCMFYKINSWYYRSTNIQCFVCGCVTCITSVGSQHGVYCKCEFVKVSSISKGRTSYRLAQADFCNFQRVQQIPSAKAVTTDKLCRYLLHKGTQNVFIFISPQTVNSAYTSLSHFIYFFLYICT